MAVGSSVRKNQMAEEAVTLDSLPYEASLCSCQVSGASDSKSAYGVDKCPNQAWPCFWTWLQQEAQGKEYDLY